MKYILIFLLNIPFCVFSQIQLEGNSITNNASGGIKPYTYSMDNFYYQTDSTFNCLSPGNYTFYIKDSSGLIVKQNIILYPSLSLNIISVTNNSISVIGLGGKPTYSYSRNSTTRWQSSGLFTGLSRRTTYTIRVRDSLGYIYQLSIRTT